MEGINERLARLEGNVSLLLQHGAGTRAMINGIATKADENFIKIEERFNKMDSNLITVESKLSKVESKLSKVGSKLSKVESKLNVLANETSNRFNDFGDQLCVFKEDVDDQLGSIKAELIKISTATRYEQYHIDQKKFNINN